MNISLPVIPRGRQSIETKKRIQAETEQFCQDIIEINSRLDFKVSSRGWCYALEEHGLLKGDFDKAQSLINDCRKTGLLPLDICAEDKARLAEGGEGFIDDNTPEEEANWIVLSTLDRADEYNPVSFWESQEYYVELLVEKIDLKSLFSKVCQPFHIPITNARGWTDLNSRAAMMQRFANHEKNGRKPVLLYCGDHDPGGLIISDSIRSNMADMDKAVGWSPDSLIIHRFGLNYDFIQEQGLSWIDNLETGSGKRLDDPRHSDYKKPYVQNYLKQYGARKVEANALVVRPEAGRQLCQEAIEQYIDPSSIQTHQNFISQEQHKVRQLLPQAIKTYLSGGVL